MRRFFCLFSIFFLVIAIIPINAQSPQRSNSNEMTPGLRRQALVIDIESRVLEGQTVVWSENNRKVSIPGVPVGVQLVGSNLILAVQFTPYIQEEGNVLVAQGQFWIAENENEMTYYTSIQTIPMELGEPIHFFPLGSSEDMSPSIEIIIIVKQYNAPAISRVPDYRGMTSNRENAR